MTGTGDAWPVDGGKITFEYDAEIIDKWVADFVPDNRDDYIVTITYANTRDEAENRALAWISLRAAARLEKPTPPATLPVKTKPQIAARPAASRSRRS